MKYVVSSPKLSNLYLILMIVQVGAPARVGLVAPIDVVVPPGNTGLDPSQTSFFQVCNIFFRITLLLIGRGLVSFDRHIFCSGAQYSNQD